MATGRGRPGAPVRNQPPDKGRGQPSGTGQTLELEITGLAAGGEGVARAGSGQVVFLPGSVPGDRVLAEVLEAHPRFLRARLLEVLTPSPDRRLPPCPIAQQCGGCPWMIMNEAAQARARHDVVAELMARLGGAARDRVQPLVEAPQSLGYRNRLRLYAVGDRVGFHVKGSSEVVDVPRCLVAEPVLNVALEAIRARLAEARLAEARPLTAPLQIELYVAPDGALQLAFSGHGARLFEGFRPVGLEGALEVFIDPRPLDARGTPRLPFAQANHVQNARLVEAAADALKLSSSNRVLDLYAGAGNFSLPLAGRVASVVGIEYSAGAVRQANALAPANAHYLAGDAASRLRELIRQGKRFDRVLLDPPRAGALEICPLLPQVFPERIVYVSCDPATLARDVRRLTELGFELESVTPFDLMPQTAHVESLAVLVAKRG